MNTNFSNDELDMPVLKVDITFNAIDSQNIHIKKIVNQFEVLPLVLRKLYLR